MMRAALWNTLGVLFLAALPGFSAARAADLTAALPANTAIYVGWSPHLEPNAPELQKLQKLSGAILHAVMTDADERTAALLKLVFQYLPLFQTNSVGLGLIDVQLADAAPDIQLALVAAGPDAAALAEAPAKFVEALDDKAEITREDVDGVPLHSVALGDSPLHLYWGLHKDRCLIALGRTAASRVIAALNGGAPTLADSTELQFDRKKLGASGTGPGFWAYADVRRVITRAKELVAETQGGHAPLVDQVVNELGLNAIRSKCLYIGKKDERAYIAAFAHLEGERRGLLKLWDQKPLTDDDLRIIPRDAYWAEVGNLDLAALWREAQRVFEALAPDQTGMVEGGLATLQQMLGFSIPDDLLPALGDTWAVFDAPAHGGLLLTGAVLVNDVPDPNKFEDLLERLVEVGKRPLAGGKVGLQLKQTRQADHDVHYLLITGIPVPVAPAWGFAEKRWVFGLYPQTVGAALRQVDSKTRGESLLDNPEFKRLRAGLPQQVQSVGYLNVRYLARLVYPLVRALQTMGVSMLGGQQHDTDLAFIPPVDEYLKDVSDFVDSTSTDADGILYAGIGSAAPFVLVPAAAALTTSVMLPSLARARQQARSVAAMADLKQLGLGLMMYANEHNDALPAALDGVKPYVGNLDVTGPRANLPFERWTYIGGQSVAKTRKPMSTVLVYTFPNDGGEHALVLYVDGHVQRIPLEQAAREVQATYLQLGREKDIPERVRELAPDDEEAHEKQE